MSLLRARNALHRGYTLIELVVSMAGASALLFGLGSALYIAGQGVRQAGAATEVKANAALSEMILEGQFALAVPERAARAVTFQLADRDGDGNLETVRYAWSGTVGDPLTRAYNGGPAVAVAEEIKHFELDYIIRDGINRVINIELVCGEDETHFQTGFPLLNL